MFTQEPIAYTALEGFMSEETLSYHYGKHHAGYVTKLNAAIEQDPSYSGLSLEDTIKQSYQENKLAVYNNAAQHFNHAFFWTCFSEQPSEMSESMAQAITNSFGSVDAFKEKFTAMATTLFGSGWVWLVKNAEGTLQILDQSNAGTPITEGLTPLMTIDVWEHAYYIDYRNNRAAYIDAFWKYLDWKQVESAMV